MRKCLLLVFAVLALALPRAVEGATEVGPGGGTPGTASNFRLVGHDALFDRGMNAALAIFTQGEEERRGHAKRTDDDEGDGDVDDGSRTFIYIGNRTDGKANHPHPGILVVDATNPRNPRVVNEIGPPFAGLPGITTRELRVWPQKKLLMVMTFRCSAAIHDCAAPERSPPARPADEQFPFDIKFFSLQDPVHPRFIESYVPTSQAGQKVKPHEMFLWVDPNNRNRALLFLSAPSSSTNPKRPQLMIVDISRVPKSGPVTEVAEGNWNSQFEFAGNPANFDFDLAVHSMAPTADGRLTHLAYLRGEYLALDTSSVVDNEQPGVVQDLNGKLITKPADRPRWGAGDHCNGHTSVGCSESHSSIQVPGRPFVLNVDEVYGSFTDPSFGWPYGWVRLIDIRDLAHPHIVGEYKIFQNTEAGRATIDPASEAFNSFSSHNPTVLPRLAFDDWHSGGVQAINIADPAHPSQSGWFSPVPEPAVATEDPALSRGPNKVVMWSYPIIKDGLIYVLDIRNGLFILKYTGEQKSEVHHIKFLEGNSNLGDAVRLAEGEGEGED